MKKAAGKVFLIGANPRDIKEKTEEGREKLLRAADRYSAKAAGTSGAALRGFTIASLRVLRILRAVNNIDS